ncbi:MAG: PTS lactose/cellobiose transporter subunit IIA, partial [Longicatena sp.]
MEDDNILTITGMKLVMHGGNARELIRDAMKAAMGYKAKEAKELLQKANEELLEGHKSQTKILQMECDGQSQGYNVLFCHGMDTLMTVKSEYEIAE